MCQNIDLDDYHMSNNSGISCLHRNIQGLNRSLVGSVESSNILNPQISFVVVFGASI